MYWVSRSPDAVSEGDEPAPTCCCGWPGRASWLLTSARASHRASANRAARVALGAQDTERTKPGIALQQSKAHSRDRPDIHRAGYSGHERTAASATTGSPSNHSRRTKELAGALAVKRRDDRSVRAHEALRLRIRNASRHNTVQEGTAMQRQPTRIEASRHRRELSETRHRTPPI